jgi:hypothetical protein
LSYLAHATGASNINLRVLPTDAGVFPFGSFTVLSSSDSDEPHIACVHDDGGMHYLERRRGLEAHVELFDLLHDMAISPSDSRAFIADLAKEFAL